MVTFQANPSNFSNLIQRIQDGEEIELEPGDYKGPYTISNSITIRGSGTNTVIFTANEPALIIETANVRLENLAIKRTVDGVNGEIALLAQSNTNPTLSQVQLTGLAPNVKWEEAKWELPASLDFGEIETNQQFQRSWQLQLGEPCQVICGEQWLQVKPSYLSPGVQQLDIQLNTVGFPPSTNCSASVILRTAEEDKTIPVTAKTIGSQISSSAITTLPKRENIASYEVGYRLTDGATKQLIRNLEDSSKLDSLPNFQKRRNYTERLIWELFGKQYYFFYVRRRGSGRNPGEEIWDLIVATDRDDSELPTQLSNNKKTLSLRAVVSSDGLSGLKLLSFTLLPSNRGQADGFSFLCQIRLLSNYQSQKGIPPQMLKQVATFPVCDDSHVPTEEQIQAWKVFLNFEEQVAQARQFLVPFVEHNYGQATRNISFKVDPESATIDSSTTTPLKIDEFWKRAQQASKEILKLILEDNSNDQFQEGLELGSIEKVDSSNKIIRVKLTSELADLLNAEQYQLPKSGFLSFEAVGDLVQIRRKQKALNKLKQGYSRNPYLGEFLFNASKLQEIKSRSSLKQQDLLMKSANQGQIRAVETVLSAPDICFIQGPPGTGKTTVIAEICYQIAKQGGRTLISSQANLAVDNALSRLENNPVIRAVRKGNHSSVAKEGQPFLEHQVVDKWLKNTADYCEQDLSERKNYVQLLRPILASSERFFNYIQMEENVAQLRDSYESLQVKYQSQQTRYQNAQRQEHEIESLYTAWENPFKLKESGNSQNTTVSSMLPSFIQNSEVIQLVNEFDTKVQKALRLVRRTNSHKGTSFNLGFWLQNTILPQVEQIQMTLSQSDEVLTAMNEALSCLNSYQMQSNTNSLNKLYEQKENLSLQEIKFQKTINRLKYQYKKIKSASSQLAKWSFQPNSEVNSALKDVYRQKSQFLSGSNFSSASFLIPKELEEVSYLFQVSETPWQRIISSYQRKFSHILKQEEKWQEVCKIEEDIKKLVKRFPEGIQKESNNLLSDFICDFFREEENINLNAAVFHMQQLRERTHQLLIEVQEPSLGFKLVRLLNAGSTRYEVIGRRLYSIRKNCQIIIQRVKPKLSVEAKLDQLSKDIVNLIDSDSSKWLNQLKNETNNKLQEEQQKIEKCREEQKRCDTEISQLSTKVKELSNQKQTRLNYAQELLEQLSHSPNLPQRLHHLSKQKISYSNLYDISQEFSQTLEKNKNYFKQLHELICSLDTSAVASKIRNEIHKELSNYRNQKQRIFREVENSKIEMERVKTQIKEESSHLEQERQWWQQIWESIPNQIQPAFPYKGIFSLQFLYNVKAQFEAWQEEFNQEEAYLNRYQSFVQDWIQRLRNPSKENRNKLKKIYLDSANVVGITCVQAAKGDFSQEFQSFDVVVIDEVSKCTPPELVIPALKGKKIVLVGDHRQLPPMLNTNTLEEVAEELGHTKEEISFLEESLFKKRFEEAPASIKTMLTTQYRMHPTIMGAINQFYEERLECGLFNANEQRAHQLSTPLIRDEDHLLWISTPQQKEFEEQQPRGTSFVNQKEVDVIERVCEQLEQSWLPQRQQGESRKEVGIITFYREQLRRIDEQIETSAFPSLELRTGTVDRFQGMERAVIIVSLVRNNRQGKIGFAKKPERVNVAFSRAQELLVIVGCQSLFTQQAGSIGQMYSHIADIARFSGGLKNVSDVLS